MQLLKSYRNDALAVDVYMLDRDDSACILGEIEFKRMDRRSRRDYGADYAVDFGAKTSVRRGEGWTPPLLAVKEVLEAGLYEHFDYCVAQRYPDGTFGIKSHRDKEMRGSIVGVSYGATRTLRMSRGRASVDIPLPHNSVYVLRSPTNDHWAHCIPLDSSTTPRISLTFRLSHT